MTPATLLLMIRLVRETFTLRGRKMKRTTCALLFGLLTTGMVVHSGLAQEITGTTGETAAPKAFRIEEDWVVLVRNPDPETCAPQIVNMMSPDPINETSYGLFEINHGSSPHFLAGGIQVQALKHDQLISKQNANSTRTISRSYDRVSYTVSMKKTDDGQLVYQMKNGRSKTWGRFASAATDLKAAHTTDLDSLNQYVPTHSVKNTSVNVGAHRVELMAQQEVRWYDSDGKLIKQDTTVRYPHRYAETVQDVTFAEYMANLDTLYTWEITE